MASAITCPNCGQGELVEDDLTGFLYCDSCGGQSQAVLLETEGQELLERGQLRKRVTAPKAKRAQDVTTIHFSKLFDQKLCYIASLQAQLQLQIDVVAAWFACGALEGTTRQVWRGKLIADKAVDKESLVSSLRAIAAQRTKGLAADAATLKAAADLSDSALLASQQTPANQHAPAADAPADAQPNAAAAGPSGSAAAGPPGSVAAGPSGSAAAAAGPSGNAPAAAQGAAADASVDAEPATEALDTVYQRNFIILLRSKELDVSVTLACLLLAAWTLRLPLWPSDLSAAALSGLLPYFDLQAVSAGVQAARDCPLPSGLCRNVRLATDAQLIRSVRDLAQTLGIDMPALNTGAFIHRYCVELALPHAVAVTAVALDAAGLAAGLHMDTLLSKSSLAQGNLHSHQKAHVLLPILYACKLHWQRSDPQALPGDGDDSAGASIRDSLDPGSASATNGQGAGDEAGRDMCQWCKWHVRVARLQQLGIQERLQHVVAAGDDSEWLTFVQDSVLAGNMPPEQLQSVHDHCAAHATAGKVGAGGGLDNALEEPSFSCTALQCSGGCTAVDAYAALLGRAAADLEVPVATIENVVLAFEQAVKRVEQQLKSADLPSTVTHV